MRNICIIALLGFFATVCFGQAADKDAIDLSGKMDTIAKGRFDSIQTEISLGGFLNVNLKNTDQWEDFELIRSDTSRMRFGGSLIFDSTNNVNFSNGSYTPELYGDFDGDGIGDIIYGGWYFKGRLDLPYFEYLPSTGFATWYKGEYFFNPRGIDFDQDGIEDFLMCAGDHRVRIFKGGTSIGNTKILYANDSIQLSASIFRMEVGKFNPHEKPMMVCYAGNKLYLIKQRGNSFAEDSVVVVSDSANGGIIVKNLYATDITADGITDLIVSDGMHIYIFKGGDNFGTYDLIPKNAFYTIKSPQITDYDHFGSLIDFGTFTIRACGDVTGSGIPYLCVGGGVNAPGFVKGYLFFYAGGKALDSLYDAIVGYDDYRYDLAIDTLHSINSTGHTVCLINDKLDYYYFYDLDFLMSKDCEKIPHKTNPEMRGVVTFIQGNSIACIPSLANKFTKVHITSDKYYQGKLTVYDILGQVIDTRAVLLDVGESTEFFNTSSWTSGSYIVRLETPIGNQSTKFLINR